MLKSHKELDVWKNSFALCKVVYRITAQLPDAERFGLIAQMRRCAVSVPSNIAEGYNRGATRDYMRYLWMANGSVAELETQLMLAADLGYLKDDSCEPVLRAAAELERMLCAMIRSLKERSAP